MTSSSKEECASTIPLIAGYIVRRVPTSKCGLDFILNFSPHDLICKLVPPDFTRGAKISATIQFNGNEQITGAGTNQSLNHHGLITVNTKRKSREDLLAQISSYANDELKMLGRIDFPFRIGSTANIGELLDRLFLYLYAIEQAKRAFREEPPFPRLFSASSLENETNAIALEPDDGAKDEDFDYDLISLEGAVRQALIKHRHRERGLRQAKIEQALRLSRGRLICEIPGCGFDFQVAYGELGKGYAQVHHRMPLASRTGNAPTKLEDLAIVCANCHVMIHRHGESRPLDTLIQRS